MQPTKPQGIPMKEALHDLKPHTKLKLYYKLLVHSKINNINDRTAQQDGKELMKNKVM